MVEVAPLSRSQLEDARAILGRWAAVAEEKLYGPAPQPSSAQGAIDGGRLAGVVVVSGRWLRILAVAPSLRRQGVGSALLAAAEEKARSAGVARLRACDQPGNYLTPGVEARDAETIAFLERRGYVRAGENENLLVALRDNPLVTPARATTLAGEVLARGYAVRRARPEDAAALGQLAGSFSAAWAFEAALALAAPTTVHLAWSGDRPVAFACIDANNRGLGWFGPAGTLPEHRGRRLGEALLLAALVDAQTAGHAEATIAWIGPRAFYERACGARQGPRFVVLSKELS